jgi:hypothetical protein
MWFSEKNKFVSTGNQDALFLNSFSKAMKNRFLMLGMLAVAVVAGGCNASNGDGVPEGIDATTGEVLAKPSATDQTETTTTAVDSVGVIHPDSVLREK